MKERNYLQKHKILSKSESDRVLLVSKETLFKTYELFQEYLKKQEESVVYWYGIESIKENKDHVICMVIPKAEHSYGNYFVSSEEAAKMGKKMMGVGLVCLAQFHTHPGKNTEHSDYDDEHAISNRNGFLSLIAPEYGNYSPFCIQAVSVHESWNGDWFMLDNLAKTSRIHITDNAIDLRGI